MHISVLIRPRRVLSTLPRRHTTLHNSPPRPPPSPPTPPYRPQSDRRSQPLTLSASNRPSRATHPWHSRIKDRLLTERRQPKAALGGVHGTSSTDRRRSGQLDVMVAGCERNAYQLAQAGLADRRSCATTDTRERPGLRCHVKDLVRCGIIRPVDAALRVVASVLALLGRVTPLPQEVPLRPRTSNRCRRHSGRRRRHREVSRHGSHATTAR